MPLVSLPSRLLTLARITPQPRPSHLALLHTTLRLSRNKTPSGPRPTAALPQLDGNPPNEVLSQLDVFGHIPPPASSIETVFDDGFVFNNGVRVRRDSVLLVNNEVFRWNPAAKGGPEETKARETGVLELGGDVWGLLDVVYPKPELIILGTGAKTLLLSPKTRARIHELGIRLDVMDSRNAAAQYNLLAIERPGSEIAAALMIAEFGKLERKEIKPITRGGR